MTEEEKRKAQIEWAKKRLADTISHLHELVRSAVRFSIVGNGTALGIVFAALGTVTENGKPPDFPVNIGALLAISAFGCGLICGVVLLVLSITQAAHEKKWRRTQLNILADVEIDVEPAFVLAGVKRHHRQLYNENVVSRIATFSIVAIVLFVLGMIISLIGSMIFLLSAHNIFGNWRQCTETLCM